MEIELDYQEEEEAEELEETEIEEQIEEEEEEEEELGEEEDEESEDEEEDYNGFKKSVTARKRKSSSKEYDFADFDSTVDLLFNYDKYDIDDTILHPTRKRKKQSLLNSTILSNENDEDDEDYDEMKYDGDDPMKKKQKCVAILDTEDDDFEDFIASARKSSVSIDSRLCFDGYDSSFSDILKRQLNNSSTSEDFPQVTRPISLPKKVAKSVKFLDTMDVIEVLRNGSEVLPAIPEGFKENVRYRISDERNVRRRLEGKKSIFVDDCGGWLWLL